MPGPVFLSGDSVTLRPPEREDLDAIREWMNDPRVWRPALGPNPMNADLGEEFFENVLTTEDDVILLACVDERSESTEQESGVSGSEATGRSEERSSSGEAASSVDEAPVGQVSLVATQYGPTATDRARRMELGYHLHPDHHGQGYGSEAASLLVQYGFADRNLRRIEADVGAFNDASIGLLESLGFEREGARREAAYYRGDYYDMLTYGLLREEWEGR